MLYFFFFNDTATTEIYTLSLHDALPISSLQPRRVMVPGTVTPGIGRSRRRTGGRPAATEVRSRSPSVGWLSERSEEHTSELQSRQYLVCRLLLEKKKKNVYVLYL